MYTYIETLETYRNPSGKYVGRVKVDGTASIFLYFDSEQTEQDIIDRTAERCAVMNSSGTKINVLTQQESKVTINFMMCFNFFRKN